MRALSDLESDMTARGAVIGAAVGGVAYYITDQNKDNALFDVLGWVVVGSQFMAVGAVVGYIIS